MGKKIKPGWFYYANGLQYQARKRTNGCEGCSLKSIILCPNVPFNQNAPDCEQNGIILVKT